LPAHALVLASASPRRRTLLAALGLPFYVEATDVDEDRYLTLPPVEAALGAARAKAAAAAALAPGRAVLAADTVVATEEEALGKPATPEEARATSGACGAPPHRCDGSGPQAPGGERPPPWTTQVTMRDYPTRRAKRYVASGDPLDKGGGRTPSSTRVSTRSDAIEGCYYKSWVPCLRLASCWSWRSPGCLPCGARGGQMSAMSADAAPYSKGLEYRAGGVFG